MLSSSKVLFRNGVITSGSRGFSRNFQDSIQTHGEMNLEILVKSTRVLSECHSKKITRMLSALIINNNSTVVGRPSAKSGC